MIVKKTKIVATIGPASCSEKTIRALADGGMNVVRLNFSHGTHETHAQVVDIVKRVSASLNSPIAILADLQGPKIRIARFTHDQITLKAKDTFTIDSNHAHDDGNKTVVGTSYQTLSQETKKGQTLILDDGNIILKIINIKNTALQCEVIQGGILKSYKGLNVRGGGLSAPCLTDKDKQDLDFALSLDVDYIALSFVKTAHDIQSARKLIDKTHSKCGIVAKIECAQALDHLDAIFDASDVVMVARGDLAIEVGYTEIPAIQKSIIKLGLEKIKPVITATQMMESMIHAQTPTRAEVSDVANAILDGTDAIMLSAETATGNYPVETIQAMTNICLTVEKQPPFITPQQHYSQSISSIQAIADAAITVSNTCSAHAIIALTESGFTARWMSRSQSNVPIYALSPHPHTLGRVAIYRDVVPIFFEITHHEHHHLDALAIKHLKNLGYVEAGNTVVLTRGDHLGVPGATNTIRILTV